MKTMFKVKSLFVDAVVQCGCCNGKSPVPVEKVKGTIKTPNGEPVIGLLLSLRKEQLMVP